MPSAVKAAGQLRTAIIDAYANSLAPVFWYLVPILAVALVLALFLKEIPLSEHAGMVARGEAVEPRRRERLHTERLIGDDDTERLQAGAGRMADLAPTERWVVGGVGAPGREDSARA